MNSEFLYLLFSSTLAGVVLFSLLDAAVKSVVLIGLAYVVCWFLRRASAATRHLIWLSTLTAALAIPLLTFYLPQWRVLPEWLTVTPDTNAMGPVVTAPSLAPPQSSQSEPFPAADSFMQMDQLPPMDEETQRALQALADAGVKPEQAMNVGWIGLAFVQLAVWGVIALVATALLFVWAVGASVLLWPMARSVRSLNRLATSLPVVTKGPLAAAIEKIAKELDIVTPRLYLGSTGMMPMVWGIRQGRVLLPAEATKWGAERLRAVMLHELAHLRRRDLLTQAIGLTARAVYWFNPLVWLAMRNLRVEQERACDDCVLRCGVKPSDYAGHVLDLSTRLEPAPRSGSVALAMANRARIEDRLHTILDSTCDRRSVSRWLGGSTWLVAGSAAISLAMLHASDETRRQVIAEAASAEVAGPETRLDQQDPPIATPIEVDTGPLLFGSHVPEPPAATPPQDKHVQQLFRAWQAAARSDGKIPGALIGRLGEKVKEYIKNNDGTKYAKDVEPILPRFQADHDWMPDVALTLLNDLAARSTIPIEMTSWTDSQSDIRSGRPLPPELKDAPWGEPTAEGLRVARPLDPPAKSYPIDTSLRSRILVHNEGKVPVLFRTQSWMQTGYEARDAMGQSVQVVSTSWLTLSHMETLRLAPGEFIEIPTPGFGVGKNARHEAWADVRVGSWIDVADGVEITLVPSSIHTIFHDRLVTDSPTGQKLKLAVIRERLDRERPLPSLAGDRELIIRRVTKDIFGNDATPEEISAFVTDKSNDAFTALANRLLRRAGLVGFIGELKPREITFRTTPADPDAEKRPKVAIGAGRYSIGDNVRLIIVGKLVDGRHTNDVEIRFWGTKGTNEPPGPPYKITVPDEFGTWAITCRPGSGILWVLTSGAVRKIDYRDPARVRETTVAPGSPADFPDEFREAVKRTMTIANVPAKHIESLLAKEPRAGGPRPDDPEKDTTNAKGP